MTEFLMNLALNAANIGMGLGALLVLVLVVRGSKKAIGTGEVDSVVLINRSEEYEEAEKNAKQVMGRADSKSFFAWRRRNENAVAKDDGNKRVMFVIDFDAGAAGSEVEELRHEISVILMTAQADDEVFLRLTSGGGRVTSYFLAAAQVARLRDSNIFVTASIDSIAASGGYVVAAVANRIIAAPQALIGNIGVIIEVPTVAGLLERIGITHHQFTSGELKRPISPFRDMDDTGKKWAKDKVADAFQFFLEHVRRYRPAVDIEKVKSGDFWPGVAAKDLGLVDQVGTSDDILLERYRAGWRIYQVGTRRTKTLVDRILDRIPFLSTRGIC